MSAPRILVVQHQDDCPPGRLGGWLEESGCRLDVRRADLGAALALEGHDGLVVLGGSPNAHDDRTAPWLPAVRALCARALVERVPTLGVCLGHQLLAATLGARSVRNPRGQQLGVLTMAWADAAASDPLLAGRPEAALQFNDDIVTDLPGSAAVLARTPTGEVQAVRYGPAAWGLQCHPEADATICAGWVRADASRYAGREREMADLLAGIAARDDAVAAAWRPVARAFGALVDQRAAARATVS